VRWDEYSARQCRDTCGKLIFAARRISGGVVQVLGPASDWSNMSPSIHIHRLGPSASAAPAAARSTCRATSPDCGKNFCTISGVSGPFLKNSRQLPLFSSLIYIFPYVVWVRSETCFCHFGMAKKKLSLSYQSHKLSSPQQRTSRYRRSPGTQIALPFCAQTLILSVK